MSVSWAADPDSKRDCGHRRCRRTSRAGGALLWAAPVIVLGAAIPDRAALALGAAAAVFAAGCVLICWPHPDDSGALEALIEATRETVPDYVPDEWVKGI